MTHSLPISETVVRIGPGCHHRFLHRTLVECHSSVVSGYSCNISTFGNGNRWQLGYVRRVLRDGCLTRQAGYSLSLSIVNKPKVLLSPDRSLACATVSPFNM